jgi:DNA-binding GntR family transcriptional regulator
MAEAYDSPLSPISRTSAKQAVVVEIRRSIMSGALKPGQRLTEQGLAAQLSVSQTTIREALVELEHLGFVQRVPPRKTYVTRFTRREIEEIYGVRVPLELAVIDLLANVPRRDLIGAEMAYQGMCAAAGALDRVEFENTDLEFHRALWTAAGNRMLAETLERLCVKLFAFGFVLDRRIAASRERMAAQAEQHRQILALILGKDIEGAKRAMAASMDRKWLEGIDFDSI